MNELAIANLHTAWAEACTVIITECISDESQQIKALNLLELAFNRAVKAYANASHDRNGNHPASSVSA